VERVGGDPAVTSSPILGFVSFFFLSLSLAVLCTSFLSLTAPCPLLSLPHSLLTRSIACPPASPPALSLSCSRSPSVLRRGAMCGRHVTNSLASLALSLTHSNAHGCHWGAGAVRDFFESTCICCTTVNRDSRRLSPQSLRNSLFGTNACTPHTRPHKTRHNLNFEELEGRNKEMIQGQARPT
jgi:hypothetical protein